MRGRPFYLWVCLRKVSGWTTSLLALSQVLAMSAFSKDSDWTNLAGVVTQLSTTQAGAELLGKARDTFKVTLDKEPSRSDLEKIFQWDHVSRTDAVLTRNYDPRTGQENRVREVSVHLKRGQPMAELLYDVAHELTHAVAGPTWDPYDPGLTAANYIWAALEGEGGEVDAIVTECRVALELKGQNAIAGRCDRYVERESVEGLRSQLKIQRERVREDFYRTGDWHSHLIQRLGQEATRFPMLSGESPRLYSSTGSAPYPVALIREYDEITAAACENSRRRLATRSPASDGSTELFLKRRCR